MLTVQHRIEYVTKDGKRVTKIFPDQKSASIASANARRNGCRGGLVVRSRVTTMTNTSFVITN